MPLLFMTTARLLRRALLPSLALVAIAASTGQAQDHTTAAGYGAGFIRPGALNPGVEGAELALDAGWLLTAFGEVWNAFGGHVGARVNGAFTQRPLEIGESVRNIDSWMLDVNLIARVLPPQAGNVVNPFFSLGGGLVSYGLGTGSELPLPEAGVTYPGTGQVRWAAVGGAGLDLTPAGFRVGGFPLGIRLEVADHVVIRSPFRGPDDERLGPIHNVRAGISLIGLGWF